ncbi:hypothetical protein ACJJIK_07795 [Microbulbifer sp. ZKSA006]|uniref:hypothetical protein n=1 Tax=Microbulbifer sp. ZKSA006 TaxID=3243390 RepID=UPI0040392128
MVYIDLNPIRANIAKTPEDSDYTSIQQRIRTAVLGKQPKELLPFVGGERLNMPKGPPFQLDHYLALMDWSDRHLDPRKRGTISQNTPPTLNRLGTSVKHWLYLNRNVESRFKSLVGSAEAVRKACVQLDKRWIHGLQDCQQFLAPRPAEQGNFEPWLSPEYWYPYLPPHLFTYDLKTLSAPIRHPLCCRHSIYPLCGTEVLTQLLPSNPWLSFFVFAFLFSEIP